MSEQTTRGIHVKVESFHIPERSRPDQDYYFFAYQVTISNLSSRTAQLVSRKWVIMDSEGHVETVEGLGVVGEQPVLKPGDSFQYTSFCPLQTPVGSMHGEYRMVSEDEEQFEAEIAPFSLAVPTAVN